MSNAKLVWTKTDRMGAPEYVSGDYRVARNARKKWVAWCVGEHGNMPRDIADSVRPISVHDYLTQAKDACAAHNRTK